MARAARLGGLVLLLLLLDARPVLAHEVDGAPSITTSALTIRWAVLLVAAVVVALVLRRSFSAAVVVAVAAGVVATAAPTVVFAVVSIAHRGAAALWLGAVLAVLTSQDRRRPLLVAVPAAAVTAGTGVVLARLDRFGLDGFAFDRLVLLKAVLFVGACSLALVAARRQARGWHRWELAGLVAASVVGALLTATTAPPAAGRLLVTAAGDVRVSVIPQQPGLNLVHVSTDQPLYVDGVATQRLAGVDGQWAVLELPPGRSTIDVGRDTVLVDTGHGGRSQLQSGADAAECASLLLGASLAHRGVSACPSERLERADQAALVNVVDWLAARGVRSVRLAEDRSARSTAAARAVRQAMRRHGLAEGNGALIVTGGWTTADATLRALDRQAGPQAGVYLAPWDLTGPLLSTGSASGPLVALPFDPKGSAARRYLGALPTGELPSAAGLRAFTTVSMALGIWASTPAAIMPREVDGGHGGHGWFPGGALVSVGPARL